MCTSSTSSRVRVESGSRMTRASVPRIAVAWWWSCFDDAAASVRDIRPSESPSPTPAVVSARRGGVRYRRRNGDGCLGARSRIASFEACRRFRTIPSGRARAAAPARHRRRRLRLDLVLLEYGVAHVALADERARYAGGDPAAPRQAALRPIATTQSGQVNPGSDGGRKRQPALRRDGTSPGTHLSEARRAR